MNSAGSGVRVSGQRLRNHDYEVEIPYHRIVLAGTLGLPWPVRGVVLFAHGSGSSRFSPRNRFVAARLQQSQFATLLLDLLTPQEEEEDDRTAHQRYDIDLLGDRL